MRNEESYKGIDVLKFVMAVFIIVLHTHPFYGINQRLNFMADVLCRIAVPYFFVATGFLLEKKISNCGRDIRKILQDYISRILKLYVVWTAVYLPIIVYTKIINSERGVTYGLFTFVRDFIFCGSYAHLWYLPATAIGVILVFFLKRTIGIKKTGILLTAFYLIGLLAQSYFGFLQMAFEESGIIWNALKGIKMIIVTSRNGVFFGGLFIYIGVIVAEGDIQHKWKPYLGRIAWVVCVFLLFAEAARLHKIGFVREEDMYLMLVPAVFFLLIISLQLEMKGKTDFLRKLSMDMYFIHMIFKFIYREFIGEAGENGLQLFLFTLTGTLFSISLMNLFRNVINKKVKSTIQ